MKSMAFTDKRCPVCGGKGRTRKAECVRCKGTGSTGGVVRLQYHKPNPDGFAKMFYKLRADVGMPLRDLALTINCQPSRLSEIESGLGELRNIEETVRILVWINITFSEDIFEEALDLAIPLPEKIEQ